jgi:hypothetical protein
MSFDELMREFAELVGRSVARRWLGRVDLARRPTTGASAGGPAAREPDPSPAHDVAIGPAEPGPWPEDAAGGER